MRSLLVLVAVLTPCATFGATIVPNTNLAWHPVMEPEYQDELGTNYMARVDQDLFGDYTGLSFAFKQVSATEYSLGATLVTLDEESDWYLVEAGDSFSKAGIEGNEFTSIFTTDHWFPAVTVGTDFYLGVNTGKGDRRDVFGWAHFQVVAMPLPFPSDDDVLIMVENVMSYGGVGIIVGVVPEPATIALTSIAFISLITLRRRR
ncbi:PEP-CTERM sorting domain-containing protein [Lacipirellula limnantheis]|uniref:PEP-CTERM protein-sorting domain-containing protein n=1 Tax=Lacipirellula limnantheis TaxID=2528024 RepID=A0A517TTH4_9BACT|nr:PEP-CTERM sorting domain-containing protein [Lacipirellula limnantheis]QDT71678.1 hypothetical protein I41_08380 [Lacipirellula limnantheis]